MGKNYSYFTYNTHLAAIYNVSNDITSTVNESYSRLLEYTKAYLQNDDTN